MNYRQTKVKWLMDWIKEARKRSSLTQEDVARLLTLEGFPYTAGAISHWETGKFHPPFEDRDFVTALAKTLRMSVRDILIHAGYSIKSPNARKETVERLLNAFNQLPPEHQDFAVDWIEALASKEAHR